jgi:hypothetical protein
MEKTVNNKISARDGFLIKCLSRIRFTLNSSDDPNLFPGLFSLHKRKVWRKSRAKQMKEVVIANGSRTPKGYFCRRVLPG